jgi:hypothetical protein
MLKIKGDNMSNLDFETKEQLLYELKGWSRKGLVLLPKFFSYIDYVFDRNKTILIGDYILSEEQADVLFEIVRNMYISDFLPTKSKYKAQLSVLAIINICKDYNFQTEEKFYEFIQKKLFINSPNAVHLLPDTKIYKIMKECFSRYTHHKLFGTTARRSYYSTILLHAYAPKSSFFALLDALWFIHNNRADDTYFNEDYSDIADAFNAFFTQSEDENAGIVIDSNSYAIRSGLRYCAIYDKELFIRIIKQGLDLLSLYYDNGSEESEENRKQSYFIQLFEEWYYFKQSNLSNKNREVQKRREPTVRDYRTAKIKYIYDEDKRAPYIDFPQMRLSGYSTDRVILTVKSGDSIVEERQLELGGNDFLRVIRPFQIDLTKFDLQQINLSIKVSRGDEVLYDSEDEFKRNILIFSADKEIIGTRIEKGYYTVFYLGDVDEIFSEYREFADHIYNVSLDIGDDFNINGEQFNIVSNTILNDDSNPVTIIGRV